MCLSSQNVVAKNSHGILRSVTIPDDKITCGKLQSDKKDSSQSVDQRYGVEYFAKTAAEFGARGSSAEGTAIVPRRRDGRMVYFLFEPWGVRFDGCWIRRKVRLIRA